MNLRKGGDILILVKLFVIIMNATLDIKTSH